MEYSQGCCRFVLRMILAVVFNLLPGVSRVRSSSSSNAGPSSSKKAETAGSTAGETSTACPSEASVPDDEDDHYHDALLATISEASLYDEEYGNINTLLTGEVDFRNRFDRL